jgi:hypothetical protein
MVSALVAALAEKLGPQKFRALYDYKGVEPKFVLWDDKDIQHVSGMTVPELAEIIPGFDPYVLQTMPNTVKQSIIDKGLGENLKQVFAQNQIPFDYRPERIHNDQHFDDGGEENAEEVEAV